MASTKQKDTKNNSAAQGQMVEPIADRVQKLLELVNVKRVYYVDDANKKSVDVEVFLGKIQFFYREGNAEKKLSELIIEDVQYSDPYEVVADRIKENWENWETQKKLELLRAVNKILEDKQLQFDEVVVPKLKDYFPEGTLYYVDPLEWETMLGNIEKDLTKDEKVLLIFDQNLKEAGGRFLLESGVNLIIQIKQSALKDVAICALLSNEIAVTDQELYYREKILDEHESQIAASDFFPLSKERLSEPEVFANGIKKTLINPHFEFIKDKTIDVIRKSHEKALDKIKKLDTYDFDDAVIRTSAKEGVWEIETLLRITEVIQKDELYQIIADTDYTNKVNPEIKESLRFNDIQFIIPEDYKPYSEKVKIRHKELYQSGELINKLHKPIENGDIFEMDNSKYILVAQPCDLMVRGGKEPKQGRRNAKYVTLLRVDNFSVADFVRKVKRPDSMSHFLSDKHGLEYLYEQAGNMGVVMFNASITVDIDILDIIVYNDDGKCIYTFPDNSFDTNVYNTAWERRFQYIKDKLISAKSRVDSAYTNVKEDTENRQAYIKDNFYPKLVANSLLDQTFEVEYNDTAFDFKIKRIANYKTFNAAYLLDRYSRFLSRTAELHDFAQKPRL